MLRLTGFIVRRLTIRAILFSQEAAGGHYTCDVRQVSGKWLRFDDEKVGPVSAGDVLRPDGPRDPYLLFYVQSSLIS